MSSDPQHLQARTNGERKTSCCHLARCAHPAHVKPEQIPMTGQRAGCEQQPQPMTPCACGSRLHHPKSATSYPVPTRCRARCWHCHEHRCPTLLATWTADQRHRRRAPACAETPARPRSRLGEEGGALSPSRSSAVLSSAAFGAHMCQVRRCSHAMVLVRKKRGKERATKTVCVRSCQLRSCMHLPMPMPMPMPRRRRILLTAPSTALSAESLSPSSFAAPPLFVLLSLCTPAQEEEAALEWEEPPGGRALAPATEACGIKLDRSGLANSHTHLPNASLKRSGERESERKRESAHVQ